MDPNMPILSPSQHGSPMGLSLGGMDVSVQSSTHQISQASRRSAHQCVSLPSSSMAHMGAPRGSMSSSMLLRLPDPQMQESPSGISAMQLRQMHMMMDSNDMSRLNGMHHSDKPSITNNSDLLKAFTTMSAEQQKSLLSNINSKLMTNHTGTGSQMQDIRQQPGHSMNEFGPSQMSFPEHDHMLSIDVPPPPMVNASANSSSPSHLSRGAFTPAGDLAFSRYSKDPSYGPLLGQNAPVSQNAQAGCDQKRRSSIMVDIGVQGNDFSSQNPGSAASTSTQERVKSMFGGRVSNGSEPLMEDPPTSPPPKKIRANSDELPKNPNRNMSGVPEWSPEEVDAVMRLYDERGRLPKWKPIADELARMNTSGDLNPVLLQKGLIRSNNAVMNKVKEILYKELGDAPSRGDNGGDGVPKRNTSGVPEWNEAEINTVLELWNKHGRQSEWKSISLELAALNSAGELNSELAAKGLQRTNNAVMNKVKELSGIARARRSRPRTLGNFALLPMEQGKTSPGLARQRSNTDMLPVPELSRLGRQSSDGLDAHPNSLDGPYLLSGIKSMSVVSPVRAGDPVPVLIQAVEPCPIPAIPHVSPVQYGILHSSPVVQQDPNT